MFKTDVREYCGHEVVTMLINVGVREFRDHATQYLSGSDPVAVSKHGRVIGYYLPLKRDREEAKRAIARFGEAVDRVLKTSNLSEDELADLLDLSKPMPE